MAHLSGSVIAVEARSNLVEKAQETLVEHGIDNAAVIKSRLVDGYVDEAPYDRILVEGGVEFIPDTLLQQLCPKGTLAAIYRPQSSPIGVASLWTRSREDLSEHHYSTRACQIWTNLTKNLNLSFNKRLFLYAHLFYYKAVIFAVSLSCVSFSSLPTMAMSLEDAISASLKKFYFGFWRRARVGLRPAKQLGATRQLVT